MLNVVHRPRQGVPGEPGNCDDGHMRRERGHSPAVEAAIIIPGLILLVGLIVVLAQIVLARQELQALASSAARAAALERSPSNAERVAIDVVHHGVGEHGPGCSDLHVSVLGGAVTTPGEEGSVSVRLRCTVPLSDVSLPMLPGAVTITAERDSPVDRYRSR